MQVVANIQMNIPDEIMLEIIAHLGASDIARFSRASRRVWSICHEPSVQKRAKLERMIDAHIQIANRIDLRAAIHAYRDNGLHSMPFDEDLFERICSARMFYGHKRKHRFMRVGKLCDRHLATSLCILSDKGLVSILITLSDDHLYVEYLGHDLPEHRQQRERLVVPYSQREFADKVIVRTYGTTNPTILVWIYLTKRSILVMGQCGEVDSHT